MKTVRDTIRAFRGTAARTPALGHDWSARISEFEARGMPSAPEPGMSFGWLRPTEVEQWDGFVGRHPSGAIYHGSNWMRVIEEAFPHMRGRVFVARTDVGTRIVAGIPIFRVRSWILGDRLVATPFANWCDPLVDEACSVPLLLDRVFRYAGTDDVSTFEFRPWDTAAEMGKLGFDVRELFRHHFVPLDRAVEVLKKACSRTCVRQWVNKAERQGVRMVPVNSASEFRACYDLLSMVRRRHALPLIPERFFAALRHHLPATQSEWWLAVREGRWIGSLLVLKANRTFSLEYAGQGEEGRAVGANQLLYMRALERAVEAGYAKFSFGRTSVHNQALSEYKRHWGTTEVELPEFVVPRVDRLRAGYRRRRTLYRLGRTCLGHIPGPLQRWVGEWCYRHWG